MSYYQWVVGLMVTYVQSYAHVLPQQTQQQFFFFSVCNLSLVFFKVCKMDVGLPCCTFQGYVPASLPPSAHLIFITLSFIFCSFIFPVISQPSSAVLFLPVLSSITAILVFYCSLLLLLVLSRSPCPHPNLWILFFHFIIMVVIFLCACLLCFQGTVVHT